MHLMELAECLEGIDHIGIAVSDFEAAVKTYRDVLGMQISGQEVLEDRGIEVCFVDTGIDSQARIELLGARREDSEISRFLKNRGSGVHHICLRVSALQTAIDGLQKRGARLIGEGIQKGAHDTQVAFLHPKGTHGVLIELVQA